jgi:hypothetical protein
MSLSRKVEDGYRSGGVSVIGVDEAGTASYCIYLTSLMSAEGGPVNRQRSIGGPSRHRRVFY